MERKIDILKELYIQRSIIEKQAAELAIKVQELNRMQEEKNELENISMEDSLTKTYNRRGMDRLYTMHWEHCLSYQMPLSVLLLDLDHFKNYNDHYGHVSGDEVLKKVAKVLKNHLVRAEDFVGRYGGEEFIIVLPDTGLDGALTVAKRINDEIAKLNIEHAYNEDFGRVTICMGIVVTIPNTSISMIDIINQADELLYLAKNTGRNQYKYIEMN